MKRKYLFLSIIFVITLPIIVLSSNKKTIQEIKNQAVQTVNDKNALLISVSDAIWEYAEIALMEEKSSELLFETLNKEGFEVEKGVAGIPSAFLATYGSGRPIIGILAEYDALPGLSQDNVPFKKALKEGEAGHGCGHNLFAAGSLGAALALKQVIQQNNIKGTIRLYGCPAEEDVGGKLYMARDGLFDDLDACLAWHPDYETKVDVKGSQAIDDLEIEFFGKASHAAFDPWKGYSALDALEMMTFGVNLLREHVRPTVRMHYVIKKGGDVPNIVPEHSALWLWVRDSTRDGVKVVLERIEKIAKGSALATGTEVKINNKGSYHEMLVNMVGSRVMQANLEKIGSIEYTKKEVDYAKKIQKETKSEQMGLVSKINELEEPLKDPEGGSTDVAEVSWITPTIHISTTCAPFGIPWHSWAIVSASKHSIGYKGMFQAAKVMAVTAVDLFLEENILIEMKKEFKEKLKGYTYKSGIPKNQKPPNTSQHVKILKKAGIIEGRRKKNKICYRITDESTKKILKIIFKGDK